MTNLLVNTKFDGISSEFLNELKLHKLEQNHGFRGCSPDAVWLYEGEVALITERINTNLVNQLISAIERFDGFLSQNKLSSVQGVLATAQAQLNDVLTGKADEPKAAAALANVTGLYNALATFFAQDLPTLMKTAVFKKAREMWEQSPTKETVPLAQLPIDHNQVKQMFATALNQRSNAGVFGTIARRFGLGQELAKGINPKQMAENLITMTFAQLDGLVSAAPKPTPPTVSQNLIKQAEQAAPAAGKGGAQPQQQGQPGAGTSNQYSAAAAALAKSSNPAIQGNAKEIIKALIGAGFTLTQGGSKGGGQAAV